MMCGRFPHKVVVHRTTGRSFLTHSALSLILTQFAMPNLFESSVMHSLTIRRWFPFVPVDLPLVCIHTLTHIEHDQATEVYNFAAGALAELSIG